MPHALYMHMNFSNLKHLVSATKHSLAGLVAAWRSEQAFRHEVLILGVLILVLWFTGKSLSMYLLVLGAWLMVMVTELLNSAIEEAFDMLTKDYDARVKRGKDMASAAIFLAILINVFVWIYVFFLQS